MEINCNKCNEDVEMEEWIDKECPNCGHSGYWDEQELDNGRDYWTLFMWNVVNKIKK